MLYATISGGKGTPTREWDVNKRKLKAHSRRKDRMPHGQRQRGGTLSPNTQETSNWLVAHREEVGRAKLESHFCVLQGPLCIAEGQSSM